MKSLLLFREWLHWWCITLLLFLFLVDSEILWLLMAIFRSVDVGHCLKYPPSWFWDLEPSYKLFGWIFPGFFSLIYVYWEWLNEHPSIALVLINLSWVFSVIDYFVLGQAITCLRYCYLNLLRNCSLYFRSMIGSWGFLRIPSLVDYYWFLDFIYCLNRWVLKSWGLLRVPFFMVLGPWTCVKIQFLFGAGTWNCMEFLSWWFLRTGLASCVPL